MIFYMAAPMKSDMDKILTYYGKPERWFHDHIIYDLAQYVLIVMGIAETNADGVEEKFFMPQDTPFIVWREAGGARDQCFYMKLDLKNPSTCEGGDLDSHQVWEAIAAKIREEGATGWPNTRCRRIVEKALVTERDRAARQARRSTVS